MRGRMIHSLDRSITRSSSKLTTKSQTYDAHGRCIHAVDRAALNKILLEELARFPNVKLFFSHKLTGADFDRGLAWLENQSVTHTDAGGKQRPEEIEINFDFMIGADGAHSAVRFHMMKFARVSYQQEYIDTLWCEFHIAPATSLSSDKDFAISPNHLHIWPNKPGSPPKMFIAIPSSDKSFTCTLFASPDTFARLSRGSTNDIEHFFQDNFPGVTPQLIPPKALADQFRKNPHLPLISIKCSPHHYAPPHAYASYRNSKEKQHQIGVVIVGDAAHAMVPFYGQGMNAGLEDVRSLFQTLDQGKFLERRLSLTLGAGNEGRMHLIGDSLASYTRSRTPAAHAIVDLSMRNFVEMREGVTSRLYLVRKKVEEWLSYWFPWSGFTTQYARVSFTTENYDRVVESVEWQGKMLMRVAWTACGAAGIGLAFWVT